MKNHRRLLYCISTVLIAIGFLSFKNKEIPTINSEVTPNLENVISVVERTVLYKGTLNGTIGITLYLNEQEHPCGGNATIINAMYKYDNQEKWILLNVTTDQTKIKYCMVEDRFTGVLLLEESEDSFNGSWISPDSKKQFKVELESVRVKMGSEFDETVIEKLDNILFDELLFNKNDC
jgi:hypothetical protein